MQDGRPFLAMQFIDGEDLSSIAAKLVLRERVQIVAQVTSGLAAAHERGLIHRDVKPSNVVVERHTGGMHAFVVDFGVACREGSKSAPTAGTPEYMSPEQVTGSTRAPTSTAWGRCSTR